MNKNSIGYWFPRLRQSGVKVPATFLLQSPCDLGALLDGGPPEGWSDFVEQVRLAAAWACGGRWTRPVFLRCADTSAKHNWKDTCHLPPDANLAEHFYGIIEYCECASFVGLDWTSWAIREMLPVKPMFTAFHEMPITREFRFFVGKRDISDASDATAKRIRLPEYEAFIDHWQPYWPVHSIQEPSVEDWQERLEGESDMFQSEYDELSAIALKAVSGFYGGDAWSVDLLETERGWFVTDMALAESSFRYDHSFKVVSP